MRVLAAVLISLVSQGALAGSALDGSATTVGDIVVTA